jgi:streptomycin 6-kinase
VTELIVPAGFAEQTVRREGTAGKAWLDSLPGLAARYCRAWGLRLDGEPMHGYVGVVVPAMRTDGLPVVLKLGWQDTETRDEPLALSTWNGQGAVLLLENSPEDGVLLLERLDAARTLDHEPIGYAVETAGSLLRRLAVPAPPELSRELRVEAAETAEELPGVWRELGEPFPRRLVEAAVEVCRDLGPDAGRLLVNEDGHFQNVLAGTREKWLMIDPKPLAADAEFGAMALVWNRATESTVDYRMAAVVEAAGLDADRARAWSLVRAVQNWLWMIEDGDTDNPGFAAVPHIAAWATAR